ncbi:MAG: hypothetical protein HY981_04005 [Candidatus Magasanikbacteria bacterium]|nr:hypothetical protein [Candidatus Magasanikbacteria bacterium]
MTNKPLELRFQPNDPRPAEAETRRPDLELVKGGRADGVSENEQLAAQRAADIEHKIQTLEKSLIASPAEDRSNLNVTQLELLNKQLPHAQQLKENLSAIRALEENGNMFLQGMRSIIAPGEKRVFSFSELQDAWANNTSKATFTSETLAKLTDELDELALQYRDTEVQIEERQKTHLETQQRLLALEESLEEVHALKQAIVDDVTSRIQIKKQGGSLVTKGGSALFEQIGTYLKEYETAADEELQRIAGELSKLETIIPLLEQKSDATSMAEFLKNLVKKSPEQKNAKDQLAEARGKQKELMSQLDRIVLIQRALGFASGHVGATPAGLSEIGSHMEFTAGAGMITPKPRSNENAPQIVARTTAGLRGHVPGSFEFGAENLMKEIQKKAEEQAARAKTAKMPTPYAPERRKIVALSDEEAAYVRNLRTSKTKTPPPKTEPALTEIPKEEIYEEDRIPAIPVVETPTLPQARTAPETVMPSSPTVTAEQIVTRDRFTPQENAQIQELRNQTIDQKATHIMDYIVAASNRSSNTLEERSARFEEKISAYINLIITPEEANAVEQAAHALFNEHVEEEHYAGAITRALRRRLEFATQKLREPSRQVYERVTTVSVGDLLGQEGGGSASAEVVTPPQDAAPLRMERKTPSTEAIASEHQVTTPEEAVLSPLDALMTEFNTKKIGPIAKKFNTGTLTYENALKQAIAETDVVIQSLAKDERKQLSQMYSDMIRNLKATRANRGKPMSAATEKLLRDIARRIDPDWKEPKKATGKWRKWIAGILGGMAVTGVATEAGKQDARTGETREAPSPEEETQESPLAEAVLPQTEAPQLEKVSAAPTAPVPESTPITEPAPESAAALTTDISADKTSAAPALRNPVKGAPRAAKDTAPTASDIQSFEKLKEKFPIFQTKAEQIAAAKRESKKAADYMKAVYGPMKPDTPKGGEKLVDVSSVGPKGKHERGASSGRGGIIERGRAHTRRPTSENPNTTGIDITVPKTVAPKIDITPPPTAKPASATEAQKVTQTDIEPTTIVGHLGFASLQLESAKGALIKLITDQRQHNLTEAEAENLRLQLISAIENTRKHAWAVRDDLKATPEEKTRAAALSDSITKMSARAAGFGIQE